MASSIPTSFNDPLVLKNLHTFTTTALGCLTGKLLPFPAFTSHATLFLAHSNDNIKLTVHRFH